MANAVMGSRKIFLGSNYYKIIGGVKQNLISAFPDKLITGDFDYANQSILSSYVIKDQRGGIGIEEMDESKDAQRCWFSELQLGYRGHLPLPRLATAITTPTGITTAATLSNIDMEQEAQWTGGARSSTQKHAGTYSWAVGAAAAEEAYQDAATYDVSWQGKTFTFSCWVYTTSATDAKIGINDGFTNTYSSFVTSLNAWVFVSVTKTLASNATRCRVLLSSNHTVAGVTPSYFDDCFISSPIIGTTFIQANFNGNLYAAFGTILAKLNAGRTEFTAVASFPATITALISAPNSMLYIYLGDTEYYWYMTTAEVFTITTSGGTLCLGATLGIEWDSKLFKMDDDGQFWYTTTPNSATAVWTATGGITNIKSGDIKRLSIGPDASGNDIIYASTTSVLKAFSYTSGIWTDTYVKLPDHPTGGMGALTWRQAIYLSYGLDVLGYVPINATVDALGLSRDDGMPQEYNGEIAYFTDGDAFLIALVDASKSSGSSKSSVFAWDGVGWQHIWSPPTTLIDDCETAWTAGASVTASVDTSDFQVGAGSAKLVVATGAAAGGILGYHAISSKNLSQHNSVSLRVKSSVACDASDLQLCLDDTAAIASPLETLNLPALVANTETKVVLTLAAAASDTAIISVGVKMAVDKGAFTLHIDQIEGQTYDGAMNSAIVSSASSGYALYFDHDSKVYYIDLQRGIRNINKLPNDAKYRDSGIHISPFFDAGSAIDSKIAKRIILYCKGMSANETITTKYRINHAYSDLDTGWTTLGTIAANGKTTYSFGSGAGIAFDDIQFRFDLARGSTNTLTPDFTAVFEYLKVVKKLWSWSFTIDASEEFDSQTPKAQWASLNTIAEASILQEFTFRGETDDSERHYVFVAPPFNVPASTGEDFKTLYEVVVVEP